MFLSSSGVMPLTVPDVPTGMKTGVRICPWAVDRMPVRALDSREVPVTRKVKPFVFLQFPPGSGAGLSDEHRVSITVEPVFFIDGNLVGVEYIIFAGKCGNQHQQG